MTLATFRRWYWTLVPLLTIAAYMTVVRIGFLSEDMGLNRTAQGELGWQALLPNPGLRFYRPLGFLLTWRLNWPIWHLNPFPYHLEGLLVHAAAAFVLALWIADITGFRWQGWLSGVLFGVFPLNMEAVGWLATQWDLWAALFGILSIWLFTKWWRRDGTWRLYLGSLVFFFLGIFTKESLFAFLPMLALSAWYVLPPNTCRKWFFMATALLPYTAVLALNLVLRQVAWGDLRQPYADASSNYVLFFWDESVEHMRPVLAPILADIFGEKAVQEVAAFSAIAILVGLVLYGRGIARLLMLAGVWIVLALAPVLNLGIPRPDLQNSRLLYLVTTGYCIGVAALLWSAVSQARRWRGVLIGATGVLIAVCITVTWIQLNPWHTASVAAAEVESELARLIPLEQRPQGMVWYLQNVPERYKGAWVLRSAMSRTRYIEGNTSDIPDIQRVDNITQAPLGLDARDSFALRWRFDEAAVRWHIDYGIGISRDAPPPTGETNTGSKLGVWDFRQCDANAMARWQAHFALANCVSGKGLIVSPDAEDPQLYGPTMKFDPAAEGNGFMRLRISVLYDAGEPAPNPFMQWFWGVGGGGWEEARSRLIPIKIEPVPHVYWAFLPASDLGGTLTRLRFDPINAKVPAEIRWIAVDMVK